MLVLRHIDRPLRRFAAIIATLSLDYSGNAIDFRHCSATRVMLSFYCRTGASYNSMLRLVTLLLIRCCINVALFAATLPY